MSARTTTSRILLNSDRADAKLVLKWADLAAENGGTFSVTNAWTEGNWHSTVVINWPDSIAIPKQTSTGDSHE